MRKRVAFQLVSGEKSLFDTPVRVVLARLGCEKLFLNGPQGTTRVPRMHSDEQG
jgi:hypothetical protein